MEPIKDPNNEASEAEKLESSETSSEVESEAAAEVIETSSEAEKTEPVTEPAKKKLPILPIAIGAVVLIGIVVALVLILGGGHTHTAAAAVRENAIAATCTEAGSYDEVVYCSDCNEEISRNKKTEAALGHSGGAATCSAKAECERCGEKYGDIAGHDYADATCMVPKTCRVCSVTDGGVLPHNFTDTVVAPTCTENGYTLHSCSFEGCDEEYKDSFTDATDHSFGERSCKEDTKCQNDGCTASLPALEHSYSLDSTLPASCEGAQKNIYKCGGCSDTYEETVSDALGHSTEGVTPAEEKMSGCTYVQIFECARCGESVEGDTVERHKLNATITTPATCSADGVKTVTCTNGCGYLTTEDIEKNSTGHAWSVGTVSDGKRIDSCSLCGESKTVTVYTGTETGFTSSESFKDTEIELNNTNISMDSGVVDAIGDKNVTLSADKLEGDDRLDLGLDGEKLSQVGNSPIYNFTINDGTTNISSFGENNFVTITLPYELAEGEDVDNIAIWFIADNGKLESIKATYNNGFVTFKTNHFSYYTVTKLKPAERCALYGHSNTAKTVLATCVSDGYTLNVCVRCHYTVKSGIVTAPGHSITSDITPAGCITHGKSVFSCSACGYSYQNRIPATGHVWSLTDSESADCTKAGFNKYACDNCDAEYSETLPQLKHSFESTAVPATCEERGYTLHECSGCDYSYKDGYTDPLGHSYTAEWSWADDHSSATLTLTCTRAADHKKTVSAVISEETLSADCSGGEVHKYTAKAEFDGIEYTDVKSVSEGEPNHNYGADWKFDGINHWHECVCGARDVVVAHEYGDGEITKQPTCVEEGVRTFKCVCSKSYTESVPATGEHNYVNGVCSDCGDEKVIDCDHVADNRGYFDLNDYGLCFGTVHYFYCDCGDVKLIDQEVSDFSCNFDYSNMESETTEDGSFITATLLCDTCDVRVEYCTEITASGCEMSRKESYSFYAGEDTVIAENLEYSVTQSAHSIKETVISVGCGGEITVYECKECSQIVDFDGFELECDGAEDYEGVTVKNDSCDSFIYDFNCEDCGLEFYLEETITFENCVVSEIYRCYVATDGVVLVDLSHYETEEEHEFSFDYELLGDVCSEGVRALAECDACGLKLHCMTDEHADIETDVECDLSGQTSCYEMVRYNVCKACDTVTDVYDVRLNCEPTDEKSETIYDGDGNEVGIRASYLCSKCGITVARAQYREYKTPCIYDNVLEVKITKGDQTLFDARATERNLEHSMEYEFTNVGASCDDGYTVKQVCTKCDLSREYDTVGHFDNDNETEYNIDGFCGVTHVERTCLVCGIVTYSYVNENCEWRFFSFEGTNANCRMCGAERIVTTANGEKDEECNYEVVRTYEYRKDSAIILTLDTVSSNTEHSYDVKYELRGESCEDGVTVTNICRDCGHNYSSSWEYHYTYEKEKYDLTESGACRGTVTLVGCPCGEETWLNISACAWDVGGSQYIGSDGKIHHVDRRYCDECKLNIQTDRASTYNKENCEEINHVVVDATVNRQPALHTEYTSRTDRHDYDITTRLLGGEGATCNDGVYVEYTCKYCDDYYYNEIDWHEAFPVKTVDSSSCGSECGGYATISVCACKENIQLSFDDSLCQFDSRGRECWADDAITGYYGSEYFDSEFCDYVCSVTDPSCGYTIRFGRYYVDKGNCIAAETVKYLFGYDARTGSYEYAYVAETGRFKAIHSYDESLISETEGGYRVSGRRYVCTECGATDIEKRYYDSSDRLVKSEEIYENDGAAVGVVYSCDMRSYAYIDGDQFIESIYMETRRVNGSRDVTEERFTRYGDYYYQTYRYDGDRLGTPSEYWAKSVSEYDFAGGCIRIEYYTDSYGASYVYENEDHRCSSRYLSDSTCTQSGEWINSCNVCGYVSETHSSNPIGHQFRYIQHIDRYVCMSCGLENENGADGGIILEDLTEGENGEDYVIGYFAEKYNDFDVYVSIIVDGEEIILSGVKTSEHDKLRAIVINKNEIKRAAEKLGYSMDDCLVKVTFVPYDAGDVHDYAIVLTCDTVNETQITEQGVYKYTKSPSGDITITLTESGRYRLYAISDGELAGTISTSEERLKRIELYHGYDCILEYDLVAGETYTLSFDLFGRSLRLDLVKM